MAEDITPGLLKKIQDDFQKNFDKSAVIADLYKKVRDGTATYAEANEFAIEVGEILANALKNNLSSAVLPDGRMYYNIAKRIIEPTMKKNYDLITEVAEQVQTSLNKSANIGIKAMKPELNQDRIHGIVNKVSDAEKYDDVAWVLDEPIKIFSQSIVDDAIKANASFQYNAGLRPRIVRTATGRCCEWCKNLEDTYSYPDVPKEVFQRHDYCRCTVDYIAGKERRNVHNGNTGKQRRYVQDQYGGYEKSKSARIAHAKQMEATEKERKAAAREKRIETWRKKREDIETKSENAIIKVEKTTLKGNPNSITEVRNKKGGIDRNYYDVDGKQIKQISNNNHGNPKSHPYGKQGEHVHDYVYDEDGRLIGRPMRDLTQQEREENEDIL